MFAVAGKSYNMLFFTESFCFLFPTFRQICLSTHDQCVPAAQHRCAARRIGVRRHHRPIRLFGRALPEAGSQLQVPASPGVAKVLHHRRPFRGWLRRKADQWKDVLRAAPPASLTGAASPSHSSPRCSSFTSDSPENQSASATCQACSPAHACTWAGSPTGVQWTQTPLPRRQDKGPQNGPLLFAVQLRGLRHQRVGPALPGVLWGWKRRGRRFELRWKLEPQQSVGPRRLFPPVALQVYDRDHRKDRNNCVTPVVLTWTPSVKKIDKEESDSWICLIMTHSKERSPFSPSSRSFF